MKKPLFDRIDRIVMDSKSDMGKMIRFKLRLVRLKRKLFKILKIN
jgi:hypothetical protein